MIGSAPQSQASLGALFRAATKEVGPPQNPIAAPAPLLDGDGPHCLLPTGPKMGLSAWTHRVPSEVVHAILQPGPCLVVGDAPGDPDCFCSATALSRARHHLGLPAIAHVDAPAPQQIQSVLRAGEIANSATVLARDFKTVVLVDNDGTRVGPAALNAMKGAERVVVIDHHEVNPTKASLGLPDDVDLVVWKDTGADAAALMVLASVLRAAEQSGASLPEEAWQDIVKPLVSAMYSDTRGFDAARTRPSTVSLLRQLVDTGALGLRSTLAGFGGGIDKGIRARLHGAIEETNQRYGDQSLGMFSLEAPALLEAWASACAVTPETTWSDVLFLALDHVEARTREAGYDVCVFAAGAQGEGQAELDPAKQAQLPKGAVKFSVRTKEGALAPSLARHLGGGGKPHEGGGVSEGSLQSILQRTQAWMQNRGELSKFAAMRNLGGV